MIGANTVTVIDGRNVRSSYFQAQAGDALAISNVSLHVLRSGDHFDLQTRTLLHPPPEDSPGTESDTSDD